MAAIQEVYAERMHLIATETHSAAAEDQYSKGEFARAAAIYAAGSAMLGDDMRRNGAPISGWSANFQDMLSWLWPWEPQTFEPRERRQDLIHAAALIIAEIERLDRISANPPFPPEHARQPVANLTSGQIGVLEKLACTNDWAIAHLIGVTTATLMSLASQGLVEYRHISSWTRWRITDAGRNLIAPP